MLLDSDTSLKIAHDIIHDANEFFKKWPWLLADPDTSPEESTVSNGYVDFEYADGSMVRIPCAWTTLLFSDGESREKITFKRGTMLGEWAPGSSWDASAIVSNVPVVVDNLFIETAAAPDSDTSIEIVMPNVHDVVAGVVKTINAIIQNLTATGSFGLRDSSYENVLMKDGEADLNDLRADAASSRDLVCTGERIVPVEKINAWPENETSPETDAEYSGNIPFECLSASGTPLNGFQSPLIDNPFYPDLIYVGARGIPVWKPTYAWVPSIGRPSAPYWQDTDGLYWHKVNVITSASRFGSPNCLWPIRTTPNKNNSETTTPPMKIEADGMIVTVKVLESVEVPICVTDRYEYKNESTWTWSPGTTKMIKGPRVCEFMVKRNIVSWDGSKISAVEYQFLPIGDLNG